MSDAAKRGRASKRDVIVINNAESSSLPLMITSVQEVMEGSEHRADMAFLRDEVHRLTEIVKVMDERRSAKDEEGMDEEGASAAFHLDCAEEYATSSSSLPLTETKKLRRLVEELSTDVKRGDPDVDLIISKMEKILKMWHKLMTEEMRGFSGINGNAVETLEPVELSEKDLIEAMDGIDLKHSSIAEYKKKPEQPKGCSRGVWMEHLKMSKKFADCIAHMCCVQRSGKVESIDWMTTKEALASVGEWIGKWKPNEPTMKQIQTLLPYEIIRRVQEYEYYNCLFCNTVHFNIKQFLGHFADITHCAKANEMSDMEGPERPGLLFGMASTFLTALIGLCGRLHHFDTTEFSAPLVKSGAKALQPSPDSIPSVDFLDKIERKYGKKINGDFNEAKLKDPVYVASLLPEIVKNHKSGLGKKLFKELHEYLGTGKSLYCHRCHWKVTNRDSFYRHVLNPFHIAMNHLEDGRQFNLLTVSINVHMRDDN